ncbi:hypothetical protein [Pseudomonas sp. GV071]|uniref:hypothetical protein n=1 Tax=Pseudomonas sp. GV071 TaxID=2135754 RepID=UPI000D4E3E3E|nr:hypothetical protein [Pseudomonas sp. GV071]PTQ72242.1 hypothetical protein C8K61_103171 [Pseudomonas sp. GV071]
MARWITAVLLAALAGCATVNETITKDGSEALSIDCSGQALKWQHCYEKAMQSCPSGYDVVGKKGRADAAPDDRVLGLEPGDYAGRSLTVTCK